MGNKTYGDINKSRALNMFLALFAYVHRDIDKPCFRQDGDNLNFFFNTTKKGLQEIWRKYSEQREDEYGKEIRGKYSEQRKDEYGKEIRKPISELLPALGVLIDKRSEAQRNGGSDVWKFEIVFWSKDRAENQRRFEAEWEKKKNEGSFPANNSNKQTLTDTPVQNSSIDPTAEPIEPTPTNPNPIPPPPPQRNSSKCPPIPYWVGRDELLAELHKDLQQCYQVLVLRGQGGIGKTSLAVKLMAACEIDTLTMTPTANCLYDNALFIKVDNGDGFDAIASEFLAAFGLGADRPSTPAQTIDLILARLQLERWLVVIDNLESVMEIDRGHAKSADVGKLLNRFANVVHKSKIVLTSRKFPDDLSNRFGQSFNPGVVADQLIPGISKEASIQLLEELGARDSRVDLERIAERVDIVQLLVWLADISRKEPGRIPNNQKLVTNEAKPIVREQWELQGVPAQDLLRRMCVLRIAMDVSGLTTLRLLQADGEAMESTPEAEEVTEKLLTGLEKSDMVQRLYDESLYKNHYILRPLMAETLQNIFTADLELLWKYAARMYGSFDEPDEDFHSFEDLHFVLEKLHFEWLSGQNRIVMVSKVFGNILLKLRQWCYWDLAEEWCNKCLEVEQNPANIAATWFILGDITRRRGNYDIAKKHFIQSLKIYTKLDDRAGIASSLSGLGYIPRKRCNFSIAKKLYNRSLEIYTELDDRAGIASSSISLGYIAFKLGDYKEAKRLCILSRKEYDTLNNQSGIASASGILGDIVCKLRDYDEANKLNGESLRIRRKLNERAGIAISLSSLGDIARNLGKHEEAKHFYNKSLKVRTPLGDRPGIATSWGRLGKNELEKGNLPEAETWLIKALLVMEELQIPDKIAELNWDLAQLYRVKGNEKARDHYAISHALYTKHGMNADKEAIESAWGVG